MRAEILSDQKRPQASLNVDLSSTGEPNNTFVPGLWYWAVSALFPATDPTNPLGESLPSFVVPASLPNIPELPMLKLIIGWDVVPGASGYRVYRAGPGQSASMLRPLFDVVGGSTQSFVDLGNAAVAGRGPLPLGAIGQWDTRLPPLAAARSRHAIVAIPSPVDRTKTWIYVLGGHTGTTQVGTMELLEVDGSDTQVYSGAWRSFAMPVSRSDMSAWVHSHSNAPAYVTSSTDTYVAIGSGNDIGGGASQDLIWSGLVTPAGNITLVSSGQSQSQRLQYCAFTATEISYWAGGLASQGLGGSATVSKMVLETGAAVPPALPGSTGTGVSFVLARGTMGCGIANAHLYVSGGQSAGDATGTIYGSVESVLF
jgi:hypothetical protein